MKLYNKEGEEIDLWTFDHLYSDAHYRVVIAHRTPNGIIRTEWMGHDPDDGDPPRMFRVLIQDGELNGQQWWFSTEAEAREKHDLYLDLLGHRRHSHWEVWIVVALILALAVMLALASVF